MSHICHVAAELQQSAENKKKIQYFADFFRRSDFPDFPRSGDRRFLHCRISGIAKERSITQRLCHLT
jgi:hypothetical protein